jgi:hypothetical protein
MVLSIKHLVFAKNTNLGDQTVAGVGFSGKAFLFYQADQITKNGTYTDGKRLSIGFASTISNGTPALASRAVAGHSDDNRAASATARYGSSSGCILTISASGTVLHNAYLKSVDGDSFTLTWSNNTSAISGYVFADVFGGDDVTDVKVTTFSSQSGHGIQTTSGVGFSGSIVFLQGMRENLNAAQLTEIMAFGMATRSGQAVVHVNSETARTTMDTWRYQHTNRCYATSDLNGLQEANVSFNGFVADGISLNYISGAKFARDIGCMVMKISGNCHVGSFNIVTGTGNQTVSGANNFSGQYALFATVGTACNNVDSTSGNNRLSIGSATSSSEEGAIFGGDEDAAADSITAVGTNEALSILVADEAATGSSTATQLAADFTSFDANGFSINKSTNTNTGTFSGITVAYALIGSIPAPVVAGAETIQPRAFVMGPAQLDNIHQGFGEGGFQPGNLPPLFGRLNKAQCFRG